ncbi:5-methylcytosine-specific restriction endonuclease system specificity protein McrC [Phascolarctobacterium succinatutens]|uniref:5-methylcytosine-specific restriction endonuclease system specificity protein McrC n=1 Tax=Phascolarctobacterium succinatutens TaxID=626940 RepID=UPI0026EBEF6F|nr:5-methylcytosine-specific restriction endonuclease system specificity protein McrC [Phascolarctobacterium succinatutens]
MIKDKSIFIKNIYYMLAYAYQSLQQENYKDIATEKFDNVHNLLAAILAKGVALQLKQGLYREYVNHQDNLMLLRGKINIHGSIKNKIMRKQLLTCDYDLLSENNLLNQIIKTTIVLLIRLANVKEKYKNELRKELLFFNNVDTLEVKSIKWSNLMFQRNNRNYQLLVGICQLIIEGLLLTTESGVYRLQSWIDEQRMCRLYEKFILEYYKKHYPVLSVKAAQIPWGLDDGVSYMLPKMQSDITLRKGNMVLIIDAKYYNHTMQTNFSKRSLISHNLYQIFTYVKNYAYSFGEHEHKVSGMLLYAKTDEEIQPDNVYQMHGNQISVKTLDLNKDFSEIKQQLARIAESHFALSKTH